MSDIVERLRNDEGIGINLTLCREAADEIERLRELNSAQAQDIVTLGQLAGRGVELEARIATLEKALHEARLYSQDNERAVLERAIARMGWPEIQAFRDQLTLGQDIYEDASGFMMRAIRCLFGLPAPDLIVTHQDAALAMVATALAKKET